MRKTVTRWTLAAALLAGLGGAAMAQGGMEGMAKPSAADCAAKPAAPLPAELAGWASPAPLTAATDKAGLDKAMLVPGTAAALTLAKTADVRYPIQPEKPGGSVSHGGLVGFTIKEAGTYRVALGSAAWIDLIEGGKPVESIAHGHGPDCSGIRKMVDFPLKPGRHLLQLSANPTADMTVMVARLP